jgi:hexosaminidase
MYNRQNNVLAPKPETFRFLESVFEELLEVFPSKYIHVGGDECSKIWWKQDTASQAFMRLNGLKNETQLQTYFIEFIAQFLKQKGRQTIGWHEINEGELDTTTIVMNWGTEKQAIDAASKGFSVINTPGKPLYFDHYQSQNPNDSLSIHGYNPLEAVYNYEPIPKAILDKGLESKIIGGQANV